MISTYNANIDLNKLRSRRLSPIQQSQRDMLLSSLCRVYEGKSTARKFALYHGHPKLKEIDYVWTQGISAEFDNELKSEFGELATNWLIHSGRVTIIGIAKIIGKYVKGWGVHNGYYLIINDIDSRIIDNWRKLECIGTDFHCDYYNVDKVELWPYQSCFFGRYPRRFRFELDYNILEEEDEDLEDEDDDL